MTTNIQPLKPYVQFVNNNKTLTTEAYNFLYNMYLRVGGSLSSLDAALLQGATWSAPAAIGSVTPNQGKFTTLEALSVIATQSLSVTAASANVNFSPTAGGVVTIKSAALGAMDNVAIGAITPAAFTGTNVTVNNTLVCSGANAAVILTPTGVGVLTIAPVLTTGAMDNVVIGASTPRAITGSTITSTGRFACNGKTPPAPTVSGGALNAYAAGANGLSAAADMQALVVQVQNIRQALINHGLMT